MTEAEAQKLNETMTMVGNMAETVSKVMGMLKIVLGSVVVCISACAYGIVWVKSTTSAIAQTQSDVTSIKTDRAETLRVWTAWQRIKDDADIKTIAAIENLNRILEYQQREIDRLRQRSGE